MDLCIRTLFFLLYGPINHLMVSQIYLVTLRRGPKAVTIKNVTYSNISVTGDILLQNLYCVFTLLEF